MSRLGLEGLLLFLLALFAHFAAVAAEPVLLAGERETYTVNAHLSFLVDATGRLAVGDISSAALRSSFVRSADEVPNFGFTHSVIWARLQIHNRNRAAAERWWLEVGHPRLQEVALFWHETGSGWRTMSSGSSVRFAERPLRHHVNLFPVDIPLGETRTYYLRVHSATAIALPVRLWTPAAFTALDSGESLLKGGVYGVLLGLGLFFLLAAPILRGVEYVQFSLALIGLLVYSAAYNGFLQQYFPSLVGDWSVRPIALGAACADFFFLAFSRNFLQTRQISLGWHRILGVLMVISALVIGLAVWIEYSILGRAITLLSLAIALVSFGAGCTALYRGYRPARFYVLATALFWLVVCIRVLGLFGLFPVVLDEIMLLITAMGMVPMLAVAFADRYAMLRREKEAAQALNLAMERQHIEELEAKIAQRTRELVMAKGHAEAASRAKGEFLAAMSHELRTPMTTILGATQLLDGSGLGPQDEKLLQAMRSAGDHLGTLVDDVLDLSRIEQGRIKIRSESFSPARVLSDTVDMLRAQVEERGNVLILKTGVLPECMQGDPIRLRQIVANLISNAVKHTEHGRVSVWAEAQVQEGMQVPLRFCVEDTGQGIAKAQQPHIFLPFEQGREEEGRNRGIGLGLAICKQLVEAMGGVIGVESEPGCGSRFWFTVPLVPIVSDVSLQKTTLPDPYTILLAEDSDPNRDILTRLLQNDGHCVTAVSNGEAAIEAASHSRFDLILMDIQMPGIDGLEAAARIRVLPEPLQAGVPIFALTASPTVEMIERCRAAGMSGVVAKPLRLIDLYAAIAGNPKIACKEAGPTLLVDETLWAEYGHHFNCRELSELMTHQQSSLEDGWANLRNAWTKGDLDTLACAAHKMASATGMAGFVALSNLASRIELAAGAKDSHCVGVLLDEFRIVSAATKAAFSGSKLSENADR